MSKELPNLSLTHLQRLQEKHIPPDQHLLAEQLFRESVSWQRWLKHFTGALGLLFLLAGAMFFYAANWHEISPSLRLVSLQIIIVFAGQQAQVQRQGTPSNRQTLPGLMLLL